MKRHRHGNRAETSEVAWDYGSIPGESEQCDVIRLRWRGGTPPFQLHGAWWPEDSPLLEEDTVRRWEIAVGLEERTHDWTGEFECCFQPSAST